MKSVGSISRRVFGVVFVALVVPLLLQSGFLVWELVQAWRTTQFDRLITVGERRLGLARSWVSDRTLFTNTLDDQARNLSVQEMAAISPGANWVSLNQQGPLLEATLVTGVSLRVVNQDRQAYLIGDQILFVPSRRPVDRGLLIPVRALREQLLLNEPDYPVDILAELGGWQPIQEHHNQLWVQEAGASAKPPGQQLASGAQVVGTNFTILTLQPPQISLPTEWMGSALRLLLGIVATILLGLLLSGWMVSRLSRPLKRLAQAMERAGHGDWNQRVEPDAWAFELNQLGQCFNTMLLNLRREYARAEQEHEHRLTLETELYLGREVQRALLPQRESRVPGLQVGCWYQSARETGGDFYDYFGVNSQGPESGSLHFCIADVAGKGLSACLFSLTFRALWRAFAYSQREMDKVARAANRLLCWDTHSSGTFVTSWLGTLHPDGTCSYVCGGHPLVILKRKDGTLEKLAPPSLAFGVDRDFHYQSHKVQIDLGDLLFLYTDGLIEQTNAQGEFFGERRLWEWMRQAPRELNAQELVDGVKRALADFAGQAEQHDDITVLALMR